MEGREVGGRNLGSLLCNHDGIIVASARKHDNPKEPNEMYFDIRGTCEWCQMYIFLESCRVAKPNEWSDFVVAAGIEFWGEKFQRWVCEGRVTTRRADTVEAK